MNKDLKKVLEYYELEGDIQIVAEDITYETDRQPHVWTVNEKYILKMTTNLEELKRHLKLSHLLEKVNIKTQTPILTRMNETIVELEQQYFILLEKIKGNVLMDYLTEDEQQLGYQLGQILANLHLGLEKITPNLEGLWDNQMCDELSDWVKEEIEAYISVSHLPKEEIKQFETVKNLCLKHFNQTYHQLPRQAIHRDFHGGNLIFDEGEFVGYIDFDLSQINARIFDVCYLCTGALAANFMDEQKRTKWINFSKQVFKGYNEVNPLTLPEKDMISDMMIAIDLIMVAFFARDGYTELADSNLLMINWIKTHARGIRDCLC